ncbi:hypothetical protein bAD24_III08890 [Burkholderia sp. AD24]|nr:hypothetical protein bAD24_III08890 [Burkholderia sp. AD24]
MHRSSGRKAVGALTGNGLTNVSVKPAYPECGEVAFTQRGPECRKDETREWWRKLLWQARTRQRAASLCALARIARLTGAQ